MTRYDCERDEQRERIMGKIRKRDEVLEKECLNVTAIEGRDAHAQGQNAGRKDAGVKM